MAAIERKVTPKSFKPAGTKAKIIIQIRPVFVILCAAVFYYAYANWQTGLEKLDSKPISSFALLGSPRFTTNNDIREVILKMGELKGFFGQDITSVREQIESMPWIKGVVVRKIWPDRLSVVVTEHVPVAIWNQHNYLSSEGVVFQLPSDKLKNANLPRLSGPDYRSETVLEAWHQIYKELKVKGMTLKSVAIDERGAWEIVLDNNITLKLGRGEWKPKIERFVTIYSQIEVPENKQIDYVDLRYKVGAAVSFVDIH